MGDPEIYRPKKKLIEVPSIGDELPVSKEKNEKCWKWKETKIHDKSDQGKNPQEQIFNLKIESESTKNQEEVTQIEKEIDQIMFVEKLINDNGFEKKQTDIQHIQAYLDLIDERIEEEKPILKPESKSHFRNALNLKIIKDKLSTRKPESKRAKTREVGKVNPVLQ